ncbi:hypothetical protein LEP1GSC062_2362 [Leptospira alexanderi serovar Manhao 3 str. L 60]|uniref:Uncharacterized protein n=1 Tax=Leptospira alexanderi serovar Manhao 3 str. L 60 TaxID=1049759 RepID=V6IA30_9LEPT|nr:hypothetical protein LEP1GSC062_2362 [Leptospira alexanderi serovar Manhao 3 str. L 60]
MSKVISRTRSGSPSTKQGWRECKNDFRKTIKKTKEESGQTDEINYQMLQMLT